MKAAFKVHISKWFIILFLTYTMIQFCNIAISQLDYSVDLYKKANFESEDEDFLEKREREAEKKEIKKKMKVLLGERDYENLLKACDKLQQLDPDDKFIDLYKKFAEEGLLKESIKPKTETSVETVVAEPTPEAVETSEESVETKIDEGEVEKEVITSVETKKPLFGKDTKLIILGAVVVFVLVGVIMILRASKKKRVSAVREETSTDEVLTEELSSDVFSDSADVDVMGESELYAPEEEMEEKPSLAEVGEELEEKLPLEETEEVSVAQEEDKLEEDHKKEFTLPSFDDVLSEGEISEPVKASSSQEVDESQSSEDIVGFELQPSEEEITVSEEHSYDSQSPLEAERLPEDVKVARNGLPLEVEPLLPAAEDKETSKELELQEASSSEQDASLSSLDQIIDEDIIKDVELPSTPVDFMPEVTEEKSEEAEVSDKSEGSQEIGKEIHKPLEPSVKKTGGSVGDLSIDDILDSITEEGGGVDSDKMSEGMSDAETVAVTPEPTKERGVDDWSVSDENSLELPAFEDAEKENEPVSEKTVEESTGIDESILSYNEDEDELDIDSIVLSPEVTAAEEKKDETEKPKKSEERDKGYQKVGASDVDTNAVYNEHYKLGYKALKEGNWKKAIYEFNIALAINPDSAEAKEKLSEARQMKVNGGEN